MAGNEEQTTSRPRHQWGVIALWCFAIMVVAGMAGLVLSRLQLSGSARLRRAPILMRLGQVNEAEAIIKGLLAKNPDYANLHFHLARVYAQQGKLDDAESEYRKSLKLEPTSLAVCIELAQLYLREAGAEDRKAKPAEGGQETPLNKASAVCLKAVELAPNNCTLLRTLGDVQSAQGKTAKAVETYRAAVQADGNNIDARMALARILRDTKHRPEAIMLLRETIGQTKDDIRPHLMLADMLEQAGDLDDATAQLRSALALRPQHPEVKFRLARLLFRNSDQADGKAALKEATSYIQAVTRQNPRNAPAQYLAGLIYLKQSMAREAVAAFQAAIQNGLGDRPDAHINLAAAHLLAGSKQEAIRCLQEALRVDPKNARAMVTLARLYLSEGWPDRAQKLAQSALDLAPNDLAALQALGDAYARLGNYEKAEEVYSTILFRDATHHPATNAMARAKIKEGDAQSVVEEYGAKVAKSPDDFELRRILAQAYLANGQIDAAIREFQKLIKQKPDSVVATLALARCYSALGQTDKALGLYGRAVRLKPKEPSLRVVYANALKSASKTEAAAEALEAAVKLRARDVRLRLMLGNLYLQMSQLNKARKHLEHAVSLDPGNVKVNLGLAAVYMKDRNYEAAVRALKKLAVLDRTQPYTSQLPLLLAKVGRIEEAIQSAKAMTEVLGLRRLGLVFHAVLAQRGGKYDEALASIREALKSDPGSELLHAIRIGIMKSAGKQAEAAKLATQLPTIFPEVKAAYRALVEFREKANHEPADLASDINLALLYLHARGMWIEFAIETCDRINKSQPNWWLAHAIRMRGMTLLKKDSKEVCEQLLRMNSDSVIPQRFLARADWQAKRMTEAKKRYEAIAKACPAWVWPHLELAGLFEAEGNVDEAIKSYDQVVSPASKKSPDSQGELLMLGRASRARVLAHLRLAQLLGAKSEYQSAVTHAESAVRGNPTWADAHLVLARSLLALAHGEVERRPELIGRAAIEAGRAAYLSPRRSEAHFTLGCALLGRDFPLQAARSLRLALSLGVTDHAEAHYFLGRALLAQNRPDMALQEFEATQKLKPKHIRCYQAGASCLIALGKTDDALAMTEKGLKLAGTDPGLLLTKGRALATLNRYPEAEDVFRKVAAAGPTRTSGLLEEASLRVSRGLIADLVAEYRQRVQATPDDPILRHIFALALLRQGGLLEAETQLKEVQKRAPDYGLATITLTQLYARVERIPDALAECQRAIKKSPKSARLWMLLGDLHQNVRQHENAEKAYRTAFRYAPDNPLVLIRMAEVCSQRDKHAEAIQWADRALAHRPFDERLLVMSARAALRANLTNQAARRFRKAFDASRGNAQLGYAAAVTYVATGRREAAKYVAKKMADHTASLPLASFLLALAELDTGDYDKALAAANAGLAKAPKHKKLRFAKACAIACADSETGNDATNAKNLAGLAPVEAQSLRRLYQLPLEVRRKVTVSLCKALAYVGAGPLWHDLAQSSVREAQKTLGDTDLASLHQIAAELASQRGDAEKAIGHLEKVVESVPNAINARLALASHYSDAGQPKQAVALYKAALKLDDSIGIAYLGLGVSLQLSGDSKSAFAAYEQAAAMLPDLADPYNNMAWLLTENKEDFEKGIALARKAVKLAPSNPHCQDTLGWLFCLKGDYRAAQSALEMAVFLKPENPRIRYHLASTYERIGDLSKALQEYETALSIKAVAFPEVARAREAVARIKQKLKEERKAA